MVAKKYQKVIDGRLYQGYYTGKSKKEAQKMALSFRQDGYSARVKKQNTRTQYLDKGYYVYVRPAPPKRRRRKK